MDRTLTRIRLVTERYFELQGLRGALVGTVFGIASGFVLFTDAWDVSGAVTLGAAFLLAAGGMPILDRYYVATFGRLAPSAAGRRFGTFGMPGMAFIAIMAGILAGGGRVYSLYFFTLAALKLWVVLRDWPFRPYHLLGVVAASMGGLIQLSSPDTSSFGPSLTAGFVLMFTSLAYTGLLDHRLLATTLKGSANDPVTEHADTL